MINTKQKNIEENNKQYLLGMMPKLLILGERIMTDRSESELRVYLNELVPKNWRGI